MKFAVFACLLVIAGVSAFPQDVAPSQERIVDLWLQNALEVLRRWIIANEYDPLIIKEYDLDYIIIDGLVQVLGYVKDLRLDGASQIYLNSVSYNPGLGRLDFDLVIPRVSLSVGEYVAEGRYGDRGGQAELSGSLVVSNIRLIGNMLLRLSPGPLVTVININLDFTVGNIEADFEAGWKCLTCAEADDVSEFVNSLLNVTISELLQTFKAEIETLLGEAIRRIINRWW